MATANHVLLQRITVTDPVSSVTFNSIPQTGYTDLKLVVSTRTNAGNNWGYITLNGSSSSFTAKNIFGNGSSTYSQNRTDNILTGFYNQGTATANTFSNAELYFPNYTSSNYKSVSIDFVTEDNSTSGAIAGMQAELWSNTAAITSITFTPYDSLVAGSTFSLYGIADVNTTPNSAPKADGGDIIKSDGTYWYHAFTASGTFTPQVNLTCDILAVAGGGSGGSGNGGGGGAGGLVYLSAQAVSASNQTVTVGAGGAAKVWVGNVGTLGRGNPGTNSQFASLTAAIGGGGGGNFGNGSNNTAASGYGSAGGNGGADSPGNGGLVPTVATGTAGQGNSGGTNTTIDTYNAGGGGGGAGSAGGNASGSNGGVGGTGSNTYSSWLSVVSMGVSGYIAGGGGGGSNGGTGGSASGGGSAGGNSVGAGNATANTGGGSGGAGAGTSSGNAGSGLVIIRYPV